MRAICLVRTDAFATRGWEDFLTTCAHEIGHQLGICTRFPAPESGERQAHHNHDQKYFPVRYYYADGTRVPANKRKLPPDQPPGEIETRLRYGLMSQGTPTSEDGQWKWIRHEDWKEANKIAADLQPTP